MKKLAVLSIALLLCADVVGLFMPPPMIVAPTLSLVITAFLCQRNKKAFSRAVICAAVEIGLCAICSFFNDDGALLSNVLISSIGLVRAFRRCLICKGFETVIDKQPLSQFSQSVQGVMLISAVADACVSAFSLPVVFLSLLITIFVRVAYVAYVVLMVKFARSIDPEVLL